MEDTNIVDLFLERDECAVAESRKKYGKALLHISYNLLLDRESAEESENDTYLEAWNRIPPHEPRTYLFAFLARIIRHISLDVCRKRNRNKRSAAVMELSAELQQCIPSEDNMPEHVLEEKELIGLLNSFLHQLPPEKMQIFMRRYWYGDPVKYIAEHTDASESKVKSILFRIRKDLKQYLEKEGYRL